MKIRIPSFVVPHNLSERVAQQQPRPLAVCTSCGYVLCSCGCCHSQPCAQPCMHESGDGEAVVEVDVHGRAWCEICQGEYLPHSHWGH